MLESTPNSTAKSDDGVLDAYDVVVIGGGFSGASSALLLKRWRPEARVLIVEQSEVFQRKVGEATVEVSGTFLHQVLGLYDYLSREHLPKHGLRYWFSDQEGRALAEMSEIGPKEAPRLASFQLDRSKLDQHLLSLAEDEGCDVLRPAKVKGVDENWPGSQVQLETAAGKRSVSTRWIIDASGRYCFLAKRKRLRERVEEHPTAAVWGHWKGALDLDSVEAMGNDPRQRKLPEIFASRRLGTNHFCGYGWWAWVIPLANGDTSIGVVYDKSLYQLPAGSSLEERYKQHVLGHDGLREILAKAELEDFLAYSHLPYRSHQYMDRGWALVGDAAAFIDPYYSPGLDFASSSIVATVRLLSDDLAGQIDDTALGKSIDEHNGNFVRSYDRWLGGLYDGKYELFGDAELTATAFLFDTALYYLGVLTPLSKDLDLMAVPLFGADIPGARIASKTMRFINQRLRKLARFRRQTGTYGRRNVGWRSYSRAFSVGLLPAVPPVAKGLRIWLRLELEYLFYRLKGGRPQVSEPVMVPAAPRFPSAPSTSPR